MAIEISIVIGAQNACSTIKPCLKALFAQVQEQAAEVIVVDGSTDGTADIVAQQFPHVKLMRSHDQQLVPQLWGLGIAQAQAPIVALTIAQCIPADDWVAHILKIAASHPEVAGIGGAIYPPDNRSGCDWAVYFSRYSAFMPPVTQGRVAEIAGDNAAYRKTALDLYWKQPENGFWETLFHHELRLNGGSLYLSPEVEVHLGALNRAWDFLRARFRHGYHYGSTCPETSGIGRLLRIVAAPLLMPFLVWRVGRRVASHRQDWLPLYLLSLPWLIFFLSAWSMGEVTGYLRPQSA